jgi:hypothetical protein
LIARTRHGWYENGCSEMVEDMGWKG